jgi:electron transport complex protein RnfG
MDAPAQGGGAAGMYKALVGIGVASGLLIVSVFQTTRPIIEANKAEALEQAIFQVLPAARKSRTFQASEGGFVPLAGPPTGPLVYGGYAEDGRLVGLAIPAAGMGYADTIRVLYGYSLEAHAIVGFVVLESKETPGLGDKIGSDATFLANFQALDVALTPDGAAPANPIVAVKHGTKTHPWQIDGITGATISSKAVAAMLRESTATWAPKVEQRKSDFTSGGAP